MKTVNVNRGLTMHTGKWDEAFCFVRGQQFAVYGELKDDEAAMAIKLCDEGATPMQAAIQMYGKGGRWARQTQGTNKSLILPSERLH